MLTVQGNEIFAVEAAINHLSNSKKEDIESSLILLFDVINDALNISKDGDLLQRLFNKDNNVHQEQFITACMLRALSQKPDVFWGPQSVALRNKVAIYAIDISHCSIVT